MDDILSFNSLHIHFHRQFVPMLLTLSVRAVSMGSLKATCPLPHNLSELANSRILKPILFSLSTFVTFLILTHSINIYFATALASVKREIVSVEKLLAKNVTKCPYRRPSAYPVVSLFIWTVVRVNEEFAINVDLLQFNIRSSMSVTISTPTFTLRKQQVQTINRAF